MLPTQSRFTLLLIVFLLILSAMPGFARMVAGHETLTGEWEGRTIEYAAHRVSLVLEPGADAASVERAITDLGGVLDRPFDRLGVTFASFPETRDPLALAARLKANRGLAIVEPDMVAHVAMPDDPHYQWQWNLRNTGQFGGTPGASIHVFPAWVRVYLFTGKPILIGVIDTGIASFHYDILITGGNIIMGKNWITPDPDDDAIDDEGHGTHVAGLMAAATNNATGIAGIAPWCDYRIDKAFDDEGTGYISHIYDAIIAQVDAEVRIINCSWMAQDSGTLRTAMNECVSNDILVVAAAGNAGEEIGPGINDVVNQYPATYAAQTAYEEHVIAVSATNQYDLVTAYSNYGSPITVAAPGGTDVRGVLSTYWIYPQYEWLAGTSMATPHVTATAGLMLTLNELLTPLELKTMIAQSADDLGDPGWDPMFGYGRLNADAATFLAEQSLSQVAGHDNEVISDAPATPQAFALSAPSPNPFNPSTTLTLTLPEPGDVHVAVFTTTGREVMVVRDGTMAAGTHRLAVDLSGQASGMYLLRARTAHGTATGKLLLVQ